MSAVTDFRVSIGFFDHPKTMALEDRLGAAGVLAVLRLWCWVTKTRPTGVIGAVSSASIERAAGWSGTPGELVAGLLEAGFLDRSQEGVVTVHGWGKHNAWVSGGQRRSMAARKAAIAKHIKREGGNSLSTQHDAAPSNASAHANDMRSQMHPPSPFPYPYPFPSPSPLPTPNPFPSPAVAGAPTAQRPNDPEGARAPLSENPCPKCNGTGFFTHAGQTYRCFRCTPDPENPGAERTRQAHTDSDPTTVADVLTMLHVEPPNETTP